MSKKNKKKESEKMGNGIEVSVPDPCVFRLVGSIHRPCDLTKRE